MNETIIITTTAKKEKILRANVKNKHLENIRFMTENNLKEHLYFSYDESAILYLMKEENIKYQVAKTFIENIYEVDDRQYKSQKLNYLVNIKRKLKTANLLKIDNTFKSYIKNKKIVFYEIDPITKSHQRMIKHLQELNCEVEIKQAENRNYSPRIFELETLEEEVEFIAIEILKLLEKNISVENIKLCNVSQDYDYTLNRIFKLYNLPLEMKNKPKMINLRCTKNIFLDEAPLKEQIINKEIPYKEQWIKILNKYNWCENENDLRILVKEQLKSTSVPTQKTEKEIRYINTKEDVKEDDYVFLINANQKEFPIIYKDEEYITDNVKYEIMKDTTIEKQKNENESIIRWIKSNPNFIITYKKKTPFHSYYPSSILEELSSNIEKIELDNKITYSQELSRQKLTKELDEFVKYGKQSNNLKILYNTYKDIPYRKYNNQYQMISPEKLKSYMKNHFKLSYSSIDQYYRCGFRYYLNSILRLVPYEETIQTEIGNLFHYGLENKDNPSAIAKKLEEELNNKEHTWKEKYFLEKVKKEFDFVLEVIKEQEKSIGLKNEFHEKRVVIPIANDASFVGVIDKIFYDEKEKLYALVDYKTGSASNTLKYITSGINMQLPIYLYLANYVKELNDAKCVGFYLQKIWLKEPITKDKDYFEEKKNQLKLSGYSINNPDELEKFDNSYKESRLIEGLKIKNDGNFYYYSKILNRDQMENMKEIVKNKINEAYHNIISANFDINPKESNFINLGCEFCPFEEVCFKTPKDKKQIKEEKDLTFLGGE